MPTYEYNLRVRRDLLARALKVVKSLGPMSKETRALQAKLQSVDHELDQFERGRMAS